MSKMKLKNLSITLFIAMLILMGASYSANKPNKPLNVDDTAKELIHLAQWEIDNAYILSHASLNLENEQLRDKILAIRQDCEQNIHQLRELIHKAGREAPPYSRDFKGFFMQGYTTMRGLLSDKGLLAALHTNMQLSTNAFGNACKLHLPEEIKEIVKRIYENKQKQSNEILSML
ncbi:MAG: hypothetical protein JWM09_587 [Francisellaceae bacterium]|nr:hypothetical protein [Francisellaceae bacterium]